MKPYFEHMDTLGKELKAGRIKRAVESKEQLKDIEAAIAEQKKKVEEAGFPTEKINARGWMTVWQRIEYHAIAYLVQSARQRRRHDQCH
jgi:glutaconyl-CoA decarboxylase